MLHVEFLLLPFMRQLPGLLNTLDAWQQGQKAPHIRQSEQDLIVTL